MAAVASSLANSALVADRYVGPCRSSSSSTSSSSSSSCSSSSSSSSTSTCSSSSSGATTEEEENSSSSWNSSGSSSSSDSEISKKKRKKKNDNKESGGSLNKKKKKLKNLKNLKKESNKKKEKNKSKSMAVRILDRKRKKTKTHIKSSAGRGDEENEDEVSSMLLLGAELLKEVEEAAAASASASAVTPTEDCKSRTGTLLLPISHYVVQPGPESRSVLLEQVMSSVPAAQWQAILPPVLKEMNIAELKQLCLQQLQLLSDSDILNIINGIGDQGASRAAAVIAGKTVSSEMAITTTEEKEQLKKKKSKKSKKSKKKAKRSERLDVGAEERPVDGGVEEESSGKTLMELLELEMRARAIKALLKKEEEGEEVEDDEWTDDVVVPLATRVENDVIQRPLKAIESAVVVVGDSNDKYKHRPSSTVHLPANNQQQLIQQTEFSRVHQDGRRRRPSSSSTAARHETLHKYQQPRHYRHHHYRQDRSRSPIIRRGEADAESSTKFNTSSTPPASPLLMAATRHTAEATDTGSQVDRINSESEPDMKRIEKKDDRSTQVVVEEEQQQEEVEYEEEGIQEVDIELGSGSDDEAHSSRF